MKVIKSLGGSNYGVALLCLILIDMFWLLMGMVSGNFTGYWDMFIKWDSLHYLDISENGYTLFRCAEDPGIPENFGEWCGNAGWMPVYPLLIWVFSLIFPAKIGAVLITKIFFFLSMVLVLRQEPTSYSEKLLKALLFGFFPGMLYAEAAFPISLTQFLLLNLIIGLQQKKKLAAYFSIIFLPWTYASGFLAAQAILISGIMSRDTKQRKELHLLAAVGLFSWVMTFVFWQITTGNWDAFFLVQKKYGYGIQLPLRTWFEKIQSLFQSLDPRSVQTLILPFILYFLMRPVITRARLNTLLPWMTIVFLIWLFPLSIGGSLSLYRSESLLAISVIFFTPTYNKKILGLMGVFLVLYLCLLWIFIRGDLV